MGSLLSILGRELNPAHDFDRVGRFPDYEIDNIDDDSKGSFLKRAGMGFYFMGNSVKHIFRGAAVGAIVGAGIGATNPNHMNESIMMNSVLGAGIDVTQYICRGMIIPEIQRGYRAIRTYFSKNKTE